MVPECARRPRHHCCAGGSGPAAALWRWTGRTVVSRPRTVLVSVAGVSLGCLLISLLCCPLPSFADPSSGFETRGTEMSDRLVALDNLLDRVASVGSGTVDRPVLSKTAGERRKRSAIDLTATGQTGNRSRHRPLKFCLQPSSEYLQVLMSGEDLWSAEAVKAQCQLQTRMTTRTSYLELCETRSHLQHGGQCCPVWSLPNTVAFLFNRSSCHTVTEADVRGTRELVERCRQYFVSSEGGRQPVFRSVRGVPHACRRNRAVFNLIYYILDSAYQAAGDRLQYAMVILPAGRGAAALSYYNSLRLDSLRLRSVSVTALSFGVRDAVFAETLVEDSWLLLGGVATVFLCLRLYTSSALLSTAVLCSVVFSCCLAYFLYTMVFRFSFFPFVNVLSSVVALGVGSDSSLMLCKAWRHCGCVEEPLVSRVESLMCSSWLGLVLTSLTTAASFFACFVSSITSLACFGVFSGSVVLCNLVVTWWWMPACLVLSGMGGDQSAGRGADQVPVLKTRALWLSLFSVVTLCSVLVLYAHGGLPVADSPSLGLFLPSHPIEKFNRFASRFHQYAHHSRLDRVVLRWIWGVEALDTGDRLDPGSRGSLQLDSSFDLTTPDSQVFLENLCKDIRKEAWYGGGAGVVGGRCFPEAVSGWMRRLCISESDSPCCEVSLPTDPSVYSQCSVRAASSLHASVLSHPLAGPYFLHPDPDSSPSVRVRVLVIEFDSNRTFTASYDDMKSFFSEVEEWTVRRLSAAPAGVSRGWFVSDFGLVDLQRSLVRDSWLSVVLSSTVVLVLVGVCTLDLRLACAAVVSMSCSIVCVAALLVLLGWKLDVLESSTASLAVGLSVDFTIHYALHYRSTRVAERTLWGVGGPLLVCMLTSCLAAAAMLPSQVLPYRRVSVFIVVLMPVSYLFSSLFFLSLLPPAAQ